MASWNRNQRLQKWQARIDFLNEQMKKTDSDMFEHFALLEIEELEAKIKRHDETPK